MKIDTEARLTIFGAVTALLASYVRHGLSSGDWGWPGWEVFLIGWGVHSIALAVLMLLITFADHILSRHVLQEEHEGNVLDIEVRYYVTLTIFVLSAAILFVARVGPNIGSSDY
jgi:hypothetical protein